jgi:transcription-repair coupling factor (superfamily II helicase)
VDLSPEQATELRELVPGAKYEPGRSQLTVGVGKDPEERLGRVVAAADALLAVATATPERAVA